MSDAEKPLEKKDPKPATPPDAEAASELSDDQLDKVAGGLAMQRFARPSPRPISTY